MKILIIGATGGTGKQLVSQGLEKGYEITALVRNPKKLRQEHPKLKVIRGNVLDLPGITSACQGQDAVISALGHKKFIIKTSILSRGTEHIMQAIAQNRIHRFICITALGINDSRFRLGLYYTLFVHPFILFYYFRDKEKQEKLIRGSALDWTIIRPGQLTHGRKRMRYQHGKGLGSYLLTKMISRADVAHFIWEELERKQYIRKVVEITN